MTPLAPIKVGLDSFLKVSLPKSLRIVYITTRISQLITLILRVVNFFNYYIAAV